MLSEHGTMRPGLLRLQNLPCARDGVSPETCVSLVAMLSEVSSLVIRTSSGLRPNLVSDFLSHVLYTMLILIYSHDYPETHSEALIAHHLHQPLPSIILLSSHVLWPTRHLQDTTL